VNATGVQLIRLSADRIVVRKGPVQLLLGGPDVAQIAETLLGLLGEGRAPEEIIESFPGPLRAEVERIMAAMTERRLIAEPGSSGIPGDALQSSFYAALATSADAARQQLDSAVVAVTGINLVARSLVRSLLEVGVGRVLLTGHPVLDNELAFGDWADELAERSMAGPGRCERAGDRLAVMRAPGGQQDGTEVSLAIATSDLGEADALVEASRAALRDGLRFLPAWISDLVGYVGPLTYPYETACFCCYRLRTDSNNPAFDVSRAVASEATVDPAGRASAGFLPPMAGIVGEIAAIEAVKAIAGFVPSDAVGRLIEINLLSFSAAVRRVLKVPRCPDCSEAMARSSRILIEDRA
jgi:bacteriocin biosynthesis cyclodehydratase domain-containing protein